MQVEENMSLGIVRAKNTTRIDNTISLFVSKKNKKKAILETRKTTMKQIVLNDEIIFKMGEFDIKSLSDGNICLIYDPMGRTFL